MRQIAATCRGDTSPRLPCFCDKSLALSLSLRYVARIQTSLNSCDRSQRQNSVAATMIFTCHTRRFVAATCRGDVSQRFVASCVSAFNCPSALAITCLSHKGQNFVQRTTFKVLPPLKQVCRLSKSLFNKLAVAPGRLL